MAILDLLSGVLSRAISHGRLTVCGSREETFTVHEALTSSFRLVPPTFGQRNCYILRFDRLSRGFPTPKERGGVSRLSVDSFVLFGRRVHV